MGFYHGSFSTTQVGTYLTAEDYDILWDRLLQRAMIPLLPKELQQQIIEEY